MQVRSEERVAEEQRRSRDLQTRLERERQLEIENFTIRYSTVEQVRNNLLTYLCTRKTAMKM
jgi:Rab11 family-interacting protein 3/4